MTRRWLAVGIVPGILILGIVLAPSIPAGDGGGTSLGKKVDFTLQDTNQQTYRLSDLKDKNAFVLVFLGTECPINKLYLPRLAELHKEFAPRGVQFLGINSNTQDSPEQVVEHVRKHAIPFPVLIDKNNIVADLLDAKRTPEVFVLDAQGLVRYQGRIDDRFGIDYQRPQPTRHDLAEALGEVLAGEKVSVPSTPVAGCFIGRAASREKGGAITFTKDVMPILQKNCQECHRPGQIGPMALLTYDDVTAWAETIREVVQDRRMPPWYADPSHGTFANDRRLTPEERATLLAWIDQGTPKGDEKDLPAPREFPEGWRIGTPDVVLEMAREYAVPAEVPPLGLPYQYFEVPTNFPEDRWVERAEAKAGATEVVHHIIVFIAPPGERFFPGNPRTPALGGTAPGDMPLVLKPGMAKRIPKGSRLVFQMHYTPNGKAQKDRSQLGLIFAKEPPAYEVVTVPIYNLALRIPPGDGNYKVESSYVLERDGLVVGMMPHMHLRGKDFLYRARSPEGTVKTLLSVPRYSFHWQSVYRPAEPVSVSKGTKIECVAHFDNSADNPNNPDPSRWVYWGDQTWEEMMIGWIDLAFERPK